jgi:ribosomal protein L21E
MNVGDRVRFHRRPLFPSDPATGTGMVIGFQGRLVIVELDDGQKTTMTGPPEHFRKIFEGRSIQPEEK